MRIRTCAYLAGLSCGSIAACGGLSHEQASDGDRIVGVAGAGGNGVGAAGSRSTGTGNAAAGANGSAPPASTEPVSTTTAGVRVPAKHRALALACDHERPPGNAVPYGDRVPCPQDGGACPVPDDCTTCRSVCLDYGQGPSCVTGSGECLSDADCMAHDNGRCQDNRGLWFCTYDSCYSDATCTNGGPCACEGESGSPGNTCLPGNCRTDSDCAGGYCSPTLGGCGNYGGVIGYYCHTAADVCLDDADCTTSMAGAGYCMYRPEVGHWACGYGQCVG